jgi:hypothetical protein
VHLYIENKANLMLFSSAFNLFTLTFSKHFEKLFVVCVPTPQQTRLDIDAVHHWRPKQHLVGVLIIMIEEFMCKKKTLQNSFEHGLSWPYRLCQFIFHPGQDDIRFISKYGNFKYSNHLCSIDMAIHTHTHTYIPAQHSCWVGWFCIQYWIIQK